MPIKKLVILLSLILSSNVFSEESFRRCMILPVTDSMGGVLGFSVFEEVERYLKNANWCIYKSNSDILNILTHYKKNLESHLKNPDVLKLVSEKSKAGTLIRIEILGSVNGLEIKMDVLASNGEDKLYSEKTMMEKTDALLIANTIRNWLEVYEKSIPYDGRVMGILGDQLTMDIGVYQNIKSGDQFKVVRPIKKRKHPLLNEVIDWELETIAHGNIFHVTSFQSQGKIEKYLKKAQINDDDWVVIEKAPLDSKNLEGGSFEKEDNQYSFGKLGRITLFTHLTSGNTTSNIGQKRELGGMLYGGGLRAELWGTRNYLMMIDFKFLMGSYSKQAGDISIEDNSQTHNSNRILFGYRYFPLGFFYGPQLDGFIGYGKSKYGMDTSVSDGMVSGTFNGIILGARGDLPVHKEYRINMMFLVYLAPGFEESDTLYGHSDSQTSYNFEVGLNYKYTPLISIDGAIELDSSKAAFRNPSRDLTFKSTVIKGGVTFQF